LVNRPYFKYIPAKQNRPAEAGLFELIKTKRASFASPASRVHKGKRLEEIFQVLHF